MMFFQFESDFVESLRCIPMVVRHKLDTCGVKLKLTHWHQFSLEQREYLTTADCDTPTEILTYKKQLQEWVILNSGKPASELEVTPDPDWLNTQQIPQQVIEELSKKTGQISLSLEQWANLTPLQRFALIKLSQPGHENRNFLTALEEFGLFNDQLS